MYLRVIPSIIQSIYPQAIWNSKGRPHLKWTFDDGPHPHSTPQLLDLLDTHGLNATFFCLGKNVKKYPQLFQEIIARGHSIGNHGYDHISGWRLSKAEFLDNVTKAAEVIESDLYRPAYGRITRGQYRDIIVKLSMKVVFWNLMPGDFDRKVTEDNMSTFLANNKVDNQLVVLHDHPDCLSKISSALSYISSQ